MMNNLVTFDKVLEITSDCCRKESRSIISNRKIVLERTVIKAASTLL